MPKPRKRHLQLGLEQARRCDPGHGGWRPGAGRPAGRVDVEHASRALVSARHPQHVTLRVVPDVRLRREWLVPTIHSVIADSQKDGFRIIEFNVLENHLHQIVEVDDARTLAAGMTGFEVRMSQRLNRKLRRSGPLFDDRFHSRALCSPTEVRNALRYVLLNARHHAAEQGRTLARDWVDSYSSAPWFDGWDRPVVLDPTRPAYPDPTVPASSWLLATGWRRLGLLSINDVPGPSLATRVVRERDSRVSAQLDLLQV